MSTELQTLNQRIAERVGENLVDLIPDDQWQAIVDKETDKFFTETAPRIIHEMLREHYMEKAKTLVFELTSSNEYDASTGDQIYNELEEFIGKSAGVIFAGMLSPAMQGVLQDLRHRLGY